MALFVPQGADFQWQYSTATATRPTTTGFGVSVTPGLQPTMGNWIQIASAANVTQEVYGISICVNNGATSATTRNILMDVGVDNAGGTAYQVVIPFLLCGNSTPYGLGSSGIWYYFPLYIPRGSSVAVRAQGTTTTAFNVYATLFGQPRRPDSIRCGSKVFSFGEVTATSSGTPVTLGTTAEGAWTQVGTATTMALWWWQVGYSCIDTTMSAAIIHADVSAGTAASKKILLENCIIQTTAAEQISTNQNMMNSYNNVAAGDLIYVRGQSSGTPDTSTGFIAYGLGG